MALATICPHCNTTFRVASDQLKLRGGIVRCGACHEVFDGNAALIDLATIAAHQAGAAAAASLPAPVPALAIDMPDEPPSEVAPDNDVTPDEVQPDDVPLDDVRADDASADDEPVPSASAAFDAEVAAIEAKQAEETAEPIYTLDFDTTFDPFGILPKSMLPTPEPESGPAPQAEITVDEEIIAQPVLDDEYDRPDDTPEPVATPVGDEAAEIHPQLLMRASAAAEIASPAPTDLQDAAIAKSARRNAAKRKKTESKPAAPPVAEIEPAPAVDEPEFVKRSRVQERTGRTRRLAMGAGSALLVLALAAQGVATFRNVLAARYPQTRALLVSTCAVFGCKVELPAQIDALSVETGELQSLGASAFSYTTLLRNPGDLVQAWPHIELTLTDANDKALVRRVFTPAEYLPQAVAPAKGFGPRSEQPVKLFFELNQVKASSYHLAIFYP